MNRIFSRNAAARFGMTELVVGIAILAVVALLVIGIERYLHPRDPDPVGPDRWATKIDFMSFSRTGGELIIVTGDRPGVRVIDTSGKETHKNLAELVGRSGRLALSGDGGVLAQITEKGLLRVWDVESERESCVPRKITLPVRCLAVSPDGSCLAFDQPEGIIVLWDLASDKEAAAIENPFKHGDELSRMVLASRGTSLALGGYLGRSHLPSDHPIGIVVERICLWRRGRDQKAIILKESWGLGHPIFSPDGKTVLWENENTEKGRRVIELWDVETASPLPPLVSNNPNVGGLQILSPDGKILSCDGRLFEYPSLRELAQLKGIVAFSPDGKTAASAWPVMSTVWAARVKFWDIPSFSQRMCVEIPQDSRWQTKIAEPGTIAVPVRERPHKEEK
jgi:WD40 repeat protein